MKDSAKQLYEYYNVYCRNKKIQGGTSIEMTVSILNSIVGFSKFHNDPEEYIIYENDTIVLSINAFLLNSSWYDELIALIEKTILITKLEIILK